MSWNITPNTAAYRLLDSSLNSRMLPEGEGREQFLKLEREQLRRDLQKAAETVASSLVAQWMKQNDEDPESVMDTTITIEVSRIDGDTYLRKGVEVEGIIHITKPEEFPDL